MLWGLLFIKKFVFIGLLASIIAIVNFNSFATVGSDINEGDNQSNNLNNPNMIDWCGRRLHIYSGKPLNHNDTVQIKSLNGIYVFC